MLCSFPKSFGLKCIGGVALDEESGVIRRDGFRSSTDSAEHDVLGGSWLWHFRRYGYVDGGF